MAKITFIADDGSVQEFEVTLPVVAPVVTPDAVEIDIILTDGSTKKFVPAQ